jgi:hypothetical protein
MFFTPHHLARLAARLAAAVAILATLTGCQAIVSNPSLAQVRVVDASPDTPGIDIYQGADGVAYNLGFGTITSYVPIPPGTYSISAATAGTRQVLSLAKPTFAAASQYTVLIGNTAGSLQQLTLKDQNQPAPSGQVALRFIAQATRVGPVDIYLVPAGHLLTTTSPILTNLRFGDNTSYQNVPIGTYTLVMLPTGTVPTGATAPSYTGTQITYTSTAVHTIILIDKPVTTTPGLQVITATDYEPPAN